ARATQGLGPAIAGGGRNSMGWQFAVAKRVLHGGGARNAQPTFQRFGSAVARGDRQAANESAAVLPCDEHADFDRAPVGFHRTDLMLVANEVVLSRPNRFDAC
ncbi:MAG: hypothetical protein ACI9S9_002897, partial [Planctomycetota bacterium]